METFEKLLKFKWYWWLFITILVGGFLVSITEKMTYGSNGREILEVLGPLFLLVGLIMTVLSFLTDEKTDLSNLGEQIENNRSIRGRCPKCNTKIGYMVSKCPNCTANL